ncbi:MAG: SAM-dependent methyltransferase, partial [Thermoactinomyces sp.]
MAKQTVGRTALGAAICRLIEQYQPDGTRLFNDRVVKELVGKPIRFLMQFAGIRNFTVKQTDAVMQGLYGAQVCRTRYIDDAVQAAISQGIGQLVILGAGLDTRPYRLSGLEHLKVFEVDLPTVQKDKREKIVKYLGRLPEHVTFVPIDFDTQSLETVLAGTAFDSSKPAVFIWEGVTQYITEEAVRRTLAFVGTSAHGSVIVFTYVLKSIIERRSDIPGADHMMDVVAKSAPWLFGLEPADISTFLNQFHLALQADVGNTYYQEKYLKPIRRNMVVS